MSQPRYSLRTQQRWMVLPHQGVFLWLDRSSAQSCHDAVGLIDEFHHLLSLGTEFYEHHGRELGSMRACQRQSGMGYPRFLYLYKVARHESCPRRKRTPRKPQMPSGRSFLLSQMSSKHFLSYAMARNEGWNPMFSLIQMSIGKHFLSYAMARKRSQHEGWNLWSKWDFAASRTIRGWRLPTTNKKMPSRKNKIERIL